MTGEVLKRANKLKYEISKLDNFIHNAENSWTGSIIKKERTYIFKCDGPTNDKEYKLDYETKNKVLEVLKIHLKELKKQLEEL